MQLPKFKDYKNQPVRYISPKMDGHMHYIRVSALGAISCITKNGKDRTDKIIGIPHLASKLVNIPPNSELMAEFHCPGVPATSVPTMINDADERLQISVFAAPLLGGEDLRNVDLPVAMNKVMMHGLDIVPVFSYWGDATAFTATEVEQLLSKAVKKKIEGWVLKESHMEGWYKLKPVKTIDAFVTDVTESDSDTYKGHMKAVRLGVYTGEWNDIGDPVVHDLGMCGGFEKHFKLNKSYEEMKKYLVGKVLAIEYREVTLPGKLKWPNVVNDDNGLVIRTDKDPHECTVEQLDG